MAGIWTPEGGDIHWHTQSLLSLPRTELSRILTYLPQNPAVHFPYSVEEMVAMGRYSHLNKSCEHVLHTLDLVPLRHRPFHTLSGGEKQRVYIARALATEAPIFLLDEPTNSLDIRHQLEFWQLLRQLATESGKTLIVATHDLIAVSRLFDEVILMHEGSIAGHGPQKALLNKKNLDSLFL